MQRLGRKILLLILFVVFIALFLFGRRGLLQLNQLKEQCRQMQAVNDSLQREITVLSERLRDLEKADSLELERAARRWGMVRPGEEIYIIKEDRDSLRGKK
jgi:cell division protein FtsB